MPRAHKPGERIRLGLGNPGPYRSCRHPFFGAKRHLTPTSGTGYHRGRGTDRTVYEFRQNGELRAIRVVPKVGKHPWCLLI